jgi:signal transduction histidine kinase
VIVAPGAGTRVVLHRPFTLEIATLRQASAEGRRSAVMPVTVQPAGAAAAPPAPTVALLDLSRLLSPDDRCADWWCLVGADGEVLLAAGGTLVTGSSLAGDGPPATNGVRPARPLDGMIASARPRDHLAERIGLAPWTVSRHRGARVPFEIVLGTRTDLLERSRQRTISLVALLALLALLAGLTGITRVVGDVSRRLAALGEHMGHLSDGDYGRRLPATAADEVGRLEDHYNRLADRLAETHLRLTEQAARLKSSLTGLRRLDKAKDDFLVLVSHEVRTPLTCIIGGVDYLRAVLGRASAEQRRTLAALELDEVVEVIASSGDRLNGFLNDALRMASIRAGNRRLQLRSLAPAAAVGPALTRAALAAAKRGIRIEDDLSGVMNWHLLGDLDALHIVFGKLLDNAVIHNRNGGRVFLREVAAVPAEAFGAPDGDEDRSRLTGRPAFAGWKEAEIVWRTIEVRNTGPVIPSDRFPALFGRFEIVGEIENHSRGSGLGLSIARALVEEHGGRMAVLSDREYGTAFYVQLPAVAADARPLNTALWDDPPEGLGGRAGDEEVGVVADTAGLDVEFDDPGAAPHGESHESGGGVDGAGGADHQEEVAVPGRLL